MAKYSKQIINVKAMTKQHNILLYLLCIISTLTVLWLLITTTKQKAAEHQTPVVKINLSNTKTIKKQIILSSDGTATILPEANSIGSSSMITKRINGAIIYYAKDSVPLSGINNISYSMTVPNADAGTQLITYISTTGELYKGVKIGKWFTTYFTPSVLTSTENYSSGLLDGEFLVQDWHDSIKYKTIFHKGTGLWKSFYADGTPQFIGAYVSGLRHGIWREYSSNNQLLSATIYKHGIVTSTREYTRSTKHTL